MRKFIVLLTIAASFMFTGTYSAAGVTNSLQVAGAVEDFNLSDYILGPGDKLEIKVYRNDELNFTQQIDASGKINYPILGDMQVAGITVYTLREKIATGLSKHLRNPQVIITVTSHQSNNITVLGGITTPGVISIVRQPTILEIISQSGGFKSSADKGNVVVIRKQQNGSTVLNLNLNKALHGDKTQDILLKKDDIVYVPQDTNKLIVLGEVTTPGAVPFDAPINILELLSKSGGLTSNANKNNVLIVRNDDSGKPQLISVDIQKALEQGDPSQNLELKKGDVVYVQRDNKRVIVLGEIKSPGSISYLTPLTLLDAISRSGGLSSTANEKKIIVVRRGAVKVINLKDIIQNGDFAQNIILQNEDIVYVPTTFIADVEAVLGHINAILSTVTAAFSPIILWPQVKSAVEGGTPTTTLSIPTGSTK